MDSLWPLEQELPLGPRLRHPKHMRVGRIIRKPLVTIEWGRKLITSVDVREVTFAPRQETVRHRHPYPVIGFVVEGTALLEVDGEEPQTLPAGSSFYEPAGIVIRRFANLSSAFPMKFIAHYLLDGAQDLIEMLPEHE